MPPGVAFHVCTRAIEQAVLFGRPADYLAFERVLESAVDRHRVRLFDYATMPNHLHLELSVQLPGELSRFMQWLCQTFARRWRGWRGSTGRGHVFQSRFHAVPVQGDEHFLTVAAYIARNPVRAGLVSRAEEWPWSGLGRIVRASPDALRILSPWPVPRPADWLDIVARPLPADRVDAIRRSLALGLPYGDRAWARRTAAQLGTLRRLERSEPESA